MSLQIEQDPKVLQLRLEIQQRETEKSNLIQFINDFEQHGIIKESFLTTQNNVYEAKRRLPEIERFLEGAKNQLGNVINSIQSQISEEQKINESMSTPKIVFQNPQSNKPNAFSIGIPTIIIIGGIAVFLLLSKN